ncbi:VanZ family protein [Pseudarthrobacter sp. IC2-21]|uniref:VanZ family protein n=1 Tax=Pseudarthrobacter sp. IC2-21 TaxID=3092262 RepID=UPI002A6B6FD7|nr:VanZ family protein [Pseudarthrobacter sp. IC2-21]
MNYLVSHKFWRCMLVAMLVPLGLIAFWPSPVDAPVQSQLAAVLKVLHTHGVPAWFNYQFVEATANVLLFVPVGFVAGLAHPKRRWWHIGVLGLVVSSCIELGQLLFLHNRFASISDIVTNAVGAVIGALLALLAFKQQQARHVSATDL